MRCGSFTHPGDEGGGVSGEERLQMAGCRLQIRERGLAARDARDLAQPPAKPPFGHPRQAAAGVKGTPAQPNQDAAQGERRTAQRTIKMPARLHGGGHRQVQAFGRGSPGNKAARSGPSAGAVKPGPQFPQQFPLSGRTAIDKHLITVATDNPGTPTVVETDDPETPNTLAIERKVFRYDPTAGDAIEQNQILKGISNIATTRSDVFTVWIRVRTIRQDPLTGRWNGADKTLIVDDSRYVMTVDRSSVDRPGERPRIVNFTKVNN